MHPDELKFPRPADSPRASQPRAQSDTDVLTDSSNVASLLESVRNRNYDINTDTDTDINTTRNISSEAEFAGLGLSLSRSQGEYHSWLRRLPREEGGYVTAEIVQSEVESDAPSGPEYSQQSQDESKPLRISTSKTEHSPLLTTSEDETGNIVNLQRTSLTWRQKQPGLATSTRNSPARASPGNGSRQSSYHPRQYQQQQNTHVKQEQEAPPSRRNYLRTVLSYIPIRTIIACIVFLSYIKPLEEYSYTAAHLNEPLIYPARQQEAAPSTLPRSSSQDQVESLGAASFAGIDKLPDSGNSIINHFISLLGLHSSNITISSLLLLPVLGLCIIFFSQHRPKNTSTSTNKYSSFLLSRDNLSADRETSIASPTPPRTVTFASELDSSQPTKGSSSEKSSIVQKDTVETNDDDGASDVEIVPNGAKEPGEEIELSDSQTSQDEDEADSQEVEEVGEDVVYEVDGEYDDEDDEEYEDEEHSLFTEEHGDTTVVIDDDFDETRSEGGQNDNNGANRSILSPQNSRRARTVSPLSTSASILGRISESTGSVPKTSFSISLRGPPKVGVTSLFARQMYREEGQEQQPVATKRSQTFTRNRKSVTLNVLDESSSSSSDIGENGKRKRGRRTRNSSGNAADVVVAVFSVNGRATLTACQKFLAKLTGSAIMPLEEESASASLPPPSQATSSSSSPTPKKIYLVGNKVDLCTSGRERTTDTTRKTAMEWAQSNGMEYAEVSAKTGEGVDELFRRIARELRGV